MKTHEAFSAWTEGSNTPETDMQPKVWHIVQVRCGAVVLTVREYAADPIDAIAQVNQLDLQCLIEKIVPNLWSEKKNGANMKTVKVLDLKI